MFTRRSPESGIPFRRDRVQFAFDLLPDWIDMQPITGVPAGFHAVPDTDYEYSLYWVEDKRSGSAELWRHLAPRVPRIHDWPHQVRGKVGTGPVSGAKVAVLRNGNLYSYEAAIPRGELRGLEIRTWHRIRLHLCSGKQQGLTLSMARTRPLPRTIR